MGRAGCDRGGRAGDEVGDERAGRIVEPDEGAREDTEGGMVGTDVGIDGAAASAEEAAVHVIPDDEGRSASTFSGYQPDQRGTSAK